jgi:hypothetical protein
MAYRLTSILTILGIGPRHTPAAISENRLLCQIRRRHSQSIWPKYKTWPLQQRTSLKILSEIEKKLSWYAIVAGDITREDLEQLLADLSEIERKADPLGFLQPDHLMIAPDWVVTEVQGHRVSVTSGQFGVTSTSNDPSWICSQCGNKGPWNGIVCLSCGNREEPD